IAMHVAWARPRWVTKEEVPPEILEQERDLITRQAQAEGKPEQVVPKIVEGRLAAFYADHVLYEQKFVKQEKFDGTVGELVSGLAGKLGENIRVRRVARLEVGEQAG
ncbi:MAG: elongation factor Ts, partial [Acidimicrobiia bacterium]